MLRTLSAVFVLASLVLAAPSVAERGERPDKASDRASGARDTATLVTRASLSAGASEPRLTRTLKKELKDTQALWRRALAALAAGNDDGTLALVAAQCVNLQARFDGLPQRNPGSRRGGTRSTKSDPWVEVRAAIPRLAERVRELQALAGDPAQASRAAEFLQEIGGRSDPQEATLTPTVINPMMVQGAWRQ